MLRKRKISIIVSLFTLMIVSLSVGYAYLTGKVKITGNSIVGANTWDIHFDNVQVVDGSVSENSNISLDSDKTLLTFNTVLTKKGEFFEFTVDVVNDGSIDAILNDVVKTDLNIELSTIATYVVTYDNGELLNLNSLFPAGESKKLKIRVEYKPFADLTNVDPKGSRFSLSLELDFVQKSGNYDLYPGGSLYAMLSSDAASDKDIDFSLGAIDSNGGSGIFVMEDTKDDEYPIYYYRGNVNNNLTLGGICYKIVRTTDTGGIKIIYNGVINEDGSCDNMGVDSTLNNTAFLGYDENKDTASGTIFGYKYDEVLDYSSNYYIYSTFTFAHDISYDPETNMYTLLESEEYPILDRVTPLDLPAGYHYACGGSFYRYQTVCDEVYGLYYFDESRTLASYFHFKNGLDFVPYFDKYLHNVSDNLDSTAKHYIDNWFTNINTYRDYFEDTEFCSDRSIYSYAGATENGSKKNYILHNSYRRTFITHVPTLTCRSGDTYSISNGKLKYPVALLSSDEAMYAGVTTTDDTDHYLYNGVTYWTMSPFGLNFESLMMAVNENGRFMGFGTLIEEVYLRPVLSLNHNVDIISGDGTVDNPYKIFG